MSKAGHDHMIRVRALGCIVCRNQGKRNSPASAHHINSHTMGGKASDFDTIPLCPFHHQHGPFGEAVHNGKRTFEARHGTEQELLEQTKGFLELGVTA